MSQIIVINCANTVLPCQAVSGALGFSVLSGVKIGCGSEVFWVFDKLTVEKQLLTSVCITCT